ncbi:MAG: T9SS type A sorting domain-containing protein, partial [Candidatus Kapaibacterium sp.]
IYPNPIQNTLFIDMGSITQYEVVISDISGNVLFSQYDQNQIDFRNFATGSYFLTLIVNNKYYNFNLIKN